MTNRISLLVFALLFFPLAAVAQNNELGAFVSTSQFEDSEIEDAGDIFDAEFDEDMGVGVLYNRYWFGGLSTEFAYQRLGADLTVSFDDIGETVGELDLDILTGTAQLHLGRGSMFDPYLGGGVAYVSGEAGAITGDEIESTDLESELELLANAGLNLNFGRSFGIFVDGKYIVYEARGEGDSDGESLDINPLIISAGLKFRF